MATIPTEEEIALLKAATRRTVRLDMAMKDAQSFRARLYAVRRTLEKMDHPLSAELQSIVLSITPWEPNCPPDKIVQLTASKGMLGVNDILRQSLTDEEIAAGHEHMISRDDLIKAFPDEEIEEQLQEITPREAFSLDNILGKTPEPPAPTPTPAPKGGKKK